MGSDLHLLKGPFFIVKKLQRDVFRKHAALLAGRALDIGCGIRPFKDLMASLTYVGLDRSVGVHPDVCGSSCALPFADGSFESVICTEVLEHLEDPSACLAEAARALTSGGHIYVSAPMCWGLHYEPHDYWRFTGAGLAHLLEKNGFEIVTIVRYGGVFSAFGQRLVDVFWTALVRIMAFAPRRNAERLASILVSPMSLFFFIAGRIGDRMDHRDALGWSAVGVKR